MWYENNQRKKAAIAYVNIKIQKIREFLEHFRKPALGIMDRYTGAVLRRKE